MIKSLLRVKKRVLFILFVYVIAPQVRALAETGGIISGTVTDDTTHAALAGAQVVVKSPSGTYKTVTDAKGEFRFLSVLPDSYSLSVTLASSYLPYSTTVIVLNGSQQNVPVVLSKTLKIIASTHSRSAGSAFQRGMTIDTYTVTGAQIDTVMGKSFNANEEDLLRSIPSVTIDKTGTVSIRGGFAFEGGLRVRGHRLHDADAEPAKHAAERRQLQPAQRRRQRSADSRCG